MRGALLGSLPSQALLVVALASLAGSANGFQSAAVGFQRRRLAACSKRPDVARAPLLALAASAAVARDVLIVGGGARYGLQLKAILSWMPRAARALLGPRSCELWCGALQLMVRVRCDSHHLHAFPRIAYSENDATGFDRAPHQAPHR